MTELEKQLAAALETLSAQSARERQRDAEQIEALQLQAEQQAERTAALEQQVEQQAGDNATLRRQFERLDGQMTRLAQDYRTLATTLRGPWT